MRHSLKHSPPLTLSENRVLKLVSQSKTNKEIATQLGISPATVKRHLENILRKLSLKNRLEAAIYVLTMNGCPHASNLDCPLESWRKAMHDDDNKWAV